MELILASTSPYRRALLDRLGVPFRCIAPEVDENLLKSRWSGVSPRVLAERLAAAKAEAVSRLVPDAVVIGGDQVVAFAGDILGKPETVDRAIEQLSMISGRSHELITAVKVNHSLNSYARTDVTRLQMRLLTLDQIRRYVAFDRPTDCAGSYKLESRGITLFETIESADHSAITGLPLIALTSILREIGFTIP